MAKKHSYFSAAKPRTQNLPREYREADDRIEIHQIAEFPAAQIFA